MATVTPAGRSNQIFSIELGIRLLQKGPAIGSFFNPRRRRIGSVVLNRKYSENALFPRVYHWRAAGRKLVGLDMAGS
jgi:hypothetical protein